MIGISGSLIWSKTLMEQIFNPSGEYRWSSEGPVSQMHSPHLRGGAPGIFWDFLRSVQMLKRERVGCGKQREATAPIQSILKLQFWFLSFQWKTCLRQNCSLGFCSCSVGPALVQNTLTTTIMMMMNQGELKILNFLPYLLIGNADLPKVWNGGECPVSFSSFSVIYPMKYDLQPLCPSVRFL